MSTTSRRSLTAAEATYNTHADRSLMMIWVLRRPQLDTWTTVTTELRCVETSQTKAALRASLSQNGSQCAVTHILQRILYLSVETLYWHEMFNSSCGHPPSRECGYAELPLTFWCLAPRMWAAYASLPVHVTSHSSQRSELPPRGAFDVLPVVCFCADSFFLCFWPSRCSRYV